MFIGLAGCLVSSGISCGVRKLIRIPRVTKKKIMYDQVLSLFFRGYQFEFYKLTSELLEACMVINFKACGIN